MNMQPLVHSYQKDLLAAAAEARLARSVRGQGEPSTQPRESSTEPHRLPRLRHGLATTMVATSAGLLAIVASSL
jgi:hypothetical protein